MEKTASRESLVLLLICVYLGQITFFWFALMR